MVVLAKEDELVVVGRGYAAFGGSTEGGERIARNSMASTGRNLR